ncbi:MAG TPA: diaminopimelate epimerase [Aeromicrobium sp.]|nr:diaminopimelate epimerase [Aeromicrobium sp.]
MAFAWLKGHGTENDFVLLPDADGSVHGALEPAFVAALCDRRRGIGADGVLRVIRTEALRAIDAEAAESESEWFMDYRNSDGSVSEMCGNGIRVFAKYLFDERLATSPVTIGTRAGDRVVVDNGNGTYSVEMGVADIGGTSKVTTSEGRTFEATDVRVGNPHAVVTVASLDEAGALRRQPDFDSSVYPDGVNIEFVQVIAPDHIAIRIHERGSGETRSCGTGAVAAAVATAGDLTRVDVPGGSLHVTRRPDGTTVLTGPAEMVAQGEIEWLAAGLSERSGFAGRGGA